MRLRKELQFEFRGSLLENFLLLRAGQSFVLSRPTTDGIRPIHIMEGDLLYSKSTDWNVNLIWNHPHRSIQDIWQIHSQAIATCQLCYGRWSWKGLYKPRSGLILLYHHWSHLYLENSDRPKKKSIILSGRVQQHDTCYAGMPKPCVGKSHSAHMWCVLIGGGLEILYLQRVQGMVTWVGVILIYNWIWWLVQYSYHEQNTVNLPFVVLTVPELYH